MIDIIIPVYNTPIDDLNRCFESVLNQTYNEYKVYIIDDGSNDDLKLYLDKYASNYDKFNIIHVKNKGVSYARNVGIENSNSKYITFVDSDDTLEKDFLKDAYEIIENNNLDTIIGGYNEIKQDMIIRTRICQSGLHIYEGKNIDNFMEKLLSSKTTEKNKEIADCPTGRIYTRLFKRDSIRNLRFDTNIHMSEDTLFMIDYTYNAKRIGIVDKVWYNYYKNDYSISNATKKEKMINNIKIFIKQIEIRKENESKENLKNAYQDRINKSNEYIYRIMKKNKDILQFNKSLKLKD